MEPVLNGPAGFHDLCLCGAGATSRVYRAVEGGSGRTLALKRLHRQLVRDGSALARLRRELLSLRRIRHAGIVAALDIIDWEGDPTIVMEYVPGEDLKERIVRAGRLSCAEGERIARALLDVLAVTHASGIVHRDVKPQNVRLGDDGRVYLLDFGSARLDAASQLTRTGTTVGTPEYMAPELFAASVYDPRVDIYGVGATVYECLTGRPPQVADSLAQLAYLRTTVDIPPVAEVVPEAGVLGRVVDRCLEREPEARYASAGLALWALAHPEAETAFLARRSSNPPCLSCGKAIPVDSTTCGHCHQYRPFSYPPGPYHVELRSLREPGRLVEYVAAQFPERATPEHLEALAHRCATLGFGPQRYVSFIDWASAEHVKRTLAEHGVHAELTTHRGALGAVMVAGLAGLLVCVQIGGEKTSWSFLFACAAVAVVAAWLGLLSPLRRARQGILSTARGPRPTAPLLNDLAGASLLVSLPLALVTFVLPPLLHQPVPAGWPWVLAALAGAIVAVAACYRSQSPFPRTVSSADPQRTRAWLSALLTSTPAPNLAPIAPAPSSSRVSGERMGAVVVLLMAAEVALVALGPGLAEQLATTWRARSTPPVEMVGRPRPVVTPAKTAAPARTPQRPAAWPKAAPAPAALTVADVPAGSRSTALVPLAVALLVTGLAWRRGRRVRKEAAEIFATLDLAALAPLAGRDRPCRGDVTSTPGAGDRFACRSVGDGFFAGALARAAELARWLPPEALATLSAALEAVCTRMPAQKQAERSLLARCILETDPELRTRFEFLALEGRMEAAAAEAWAARLEGGP